MASSKSMASSIVQGDTWVRHTLRPSNRTEVVDEGGEQNEPMAPKTGWSYPLKDIAVVKTKAHKYADKAGVDVRIVLDVVGAVGQTLPARLVSRAQRMAVIIG